MKKNLIALLPLFILVGMLHTQTVFADRDDEANKSYLDAYNMYKLGKLDQSLEMLKKVVAINPDHAEAHFGMGSIYFRQNMFDDAVKEFTKVTRIKPEYVEAYQRLWLAYKKLGMNDKAEEELAKYKRLIEERMQSMGGGSPQVAKPVAPPTQREELRETSKPEESRPSGTIPPETTSLDTGVTEPRHPDTGTRMEKPVVAKPAAPAPESRPSVVEQQAPVVETKPLKAKPAETPKPSSEVKSTTKLDTEHKSPYIKIDRNDPTYKNLFKPFTKMGSTLFQSPLKKGALKWKKSYFGKLAKGFIYYIVVVQIWLSIVASLCIYFFKPKKK